MNQPPRFILLLSFLWAATSFLSAQDTDTYPRLRTATGLALEMGQSHEIVYADPKTTTYVSELIWPIPTALGALVQADFLWGPGLTTSLQLTGLQSLMKGTMTDDDWNAPTDSGLMLRGHSEHNAYLLSNWGLRLEQSFGWSAPAWKITPLLGLKFQHYFWEGWGGSGTYTYTWGTVSDIFSGAVIDYWQNWYIPYGGLHSQFDLTPLTLGLSLRYSPYLICLDTDKHLTTGPSTYLDFAVGGQWLEPELEIALQIAPTWQIALRGQWSYAWGQRGDVTGALTRQFTSPAVTYSNQGGTGLNHWSLALMVRND